MELTSYVALSYLTAQSRGLEVTAANLANAGTSGFKAERMLFSDWLGTQRGTDRSHGAGPVAFVQDRATWRERAPGSISHTGNPLDLALGSDGYFTVDTARGPRLTRAGRFTPQPDGRLVDAEGHALLDTAGQPLRVGAADTQIRIAADGTVASENGPIGRIGVVAAADPMQMRLEGGTTLRSDSATAPVPAPAIIQGAIEDSNVQPILEMTRMMAGMRQFQFASQMVETEGARRQQAIDKLTQRKV